MARRLTILALFLATWLGLSSLHVAGAPVTGGLPVATTILALLVALVSGDLVERLGVPALTGYVLAGLILGPGTEFLDGALLWDLVPIQEAALAIIAFSAGLQLNLRAPTRLARPALGAAILTGLAGLIVLGGAGLMIAALWSAGDTGNAFTHSHALWLGILAMGTSPSIVGWVVSAADRPGEIAALALTTTLSRALLLTLGIATALSITGIDWTSAVTPLLSSVGAALGIAIVLRLAAPRLDRRAALPLAVMLGVGVYTLSALGADPVLSLALAGVLTRHWTEDARRRDLDAGAEDLKLPAALVLFTLMGATATNLSIPLLFGVVGLVLTRGASLWLGSTLAGLWTKAPETFQQKGWLLLLPQGPLTLGALATLSTLAPETALVLRAPVEGMVLLGMLLGPIACRIALRAAGEQGATFAGDERAHSSPKSAAPIDGPDQPWRDPMSALAGPDDTAPHEAWRETVQGLVHLRSRVREQVVGGRLERLAKTHKAVATLARQVVQNAGEAANKIEDSEARRRHFHEARVTLVEGVHGEIVLLLEELDGAGTSATGLIEMLAEEMAPIVRSAPTLIQAQESERHVTQAADDPRWVRAGKLAKRLTRSAQGFLGRESPVREIPYRRLVRRALAGEMLATLGPVEALISRAEYKAMRRLEAHLKRADEVLVEAAKRSDEAPEVLRAWTQERVADLREASKNAQGDIHVLAEEPLHRVSEAMAAALNRLAHMTDIAGTFALTEQAIRYAAIAPEVRQALADSETQGSAWIARKRAQVERILLDLRLAKLEVGLRDLVLGRALGPAVRMHTRVQTLMLLARDTVQSTRDRVASGAIPANAEAEAEAAEALLGDLQRRVARPLEGLIDGLRSGGVVDRLIGALETATAMLPEQSHLLPEESILALERGVSTDGQPVAIRLRDTARSFFDRRVAVSLAEHSRALETSAEEARAGIRDTQRLLSVHIARAAAARSRGAEEEVTETTSESNQGVHRLTLEALDTVLERLRHAVEQTGETSSALLHEIAQTEALAVRELWQHVHTLAMRSQLDESVWSLWRMARSAMESLAQQERIRRLRALWESLEGKIRATRQVVEAREETTLGGPTRIREAMRTVDPAHQSMPYVYGKLFSLEPTENDAFVLGRERELSLLRGRLEAQGHGATITLGERGSGRSSLIRVALADAGRERPVIWLDTEQPLQGTAEVVRWAARAMGLSDSEPTQEVVASEIRQRSPLVVLDGLESLFNRSKAGLDALDALMSLIVETDRHALWLVTCERNVWRLFSAVAPISDVFDLTIDLRSLSVADLREAIERRHRLSGLETLFARPRNLDIGDWFAHLWGTSPADRFFRRLADTSEGNPRTAMHLWQLGLTHQAKGQRVVEVRTGATLVLNALRTLSPHLAPALALVYRQSTVDRSSLEVGLGWSPTQVSAALHALEVSGLLHSRTRADSETAWSLAPHACGPIRHYLKDQGLLGMHRRTG